jgi:hypothetical protein
MNLYSKEIFYLLQKWNKIIAQRRYITDFCF